MTKRFFVFGEIHNNLGNVSHITKQIESIKPDYILHELLYDDVCYTRSTIEHRLEKCKVGAKCDPRINKDIYELGLKLNAKLIGIDLNDPEIDKLPLKEQFKKREHHMATVIRSFMEADYKFKPMIVVVVGDTHLRKEESEELGPASPIIDLFKDNKEVELQRAPPSLQEMP